MFNEYGLFYIKKNKLNINICLSLYIVAKNVKYIKENIPTSILILNVLNWRAYYLFLFYPSRFTIELDHNTEKRNNFNTC